MGHVATKQEIVSIIRRFDLDGDCKISLEEVQEGLISHNKLRGGKRKSRTAKKTTLQKRAFQTETSLTTKDNTISNSRYATPNKRSSGLKLKSAKSRAKSN